MPLLRRYRNQWLRKALFFLTTAWFLIDIIRFHSLSFSGDRRVSHGSASSPRVFIASTHWNNEHILRNYWNQAVLDLVDYFGSNNTFVSVYESGSWDDSKGALRDLQEKLKAVDARHKVVLDDTTHEDEITQGPGARGDGWIDTPRGKKELRRIPYLSRLRNLSLKPLEELAEEGIYFDKILFLNDVVFTLEDTLTLLNTNSGLYAAACSLDFSKAPNYYDTFALRDSEGHEAVMSTWPYFRAAHSRSALKHNQPVPVSSCWNGMVFMDAAPFYSEPALRFRGISDSLALSHLEGSECCLIHQDNPKSRTHGVYVNPNVKVGYNWEAYEKMNIPGYRMPFLQYLYATWENRVRRWFSTDWFKMRIVKSRVRSWERSAKHRSEAGIDCLINEMQVLVNNGWAHV